MNRLCFLNRYKHKQIGREKNLLRSGVDANINANSDNRIMLHSYYIVTTLRYLEITVKTFNILQFQE